MRLLSKLDGDLYTCGDLIHALEKIAYEKPQEYKPAFPSVGELRDRIEDERKLRMRDTAKAACDDRMARMVAFAEAERIKRENEWNERKRQHELSSATR